MLGRPSQNVSSSLFPQIKFRAGHFMSWTRIHPPYRSNYAFRLSHVNLHLKFIRYCIYKYTSRVGVCPTGCSVHILRTAI